MPESDRTVNGDFEIITGEHTFKAVSYKRYMSWKSKPEEPGHIVINMRTLKTDTDEVNMPLPKNESVKVTATNFRLVAYTID